MNKDKISTWNISSSISLQCHNHKYGLTSQIDSNEYHFSHIKKITIDKLEITKTFSNSEADGTIKITLTD